MSWCLELGYLLVICLTTNSRTCVCYLIFYIVNSHILGKPKGVLHSTAGYMLYTATTFKHSFDHQPETDVYWCTADIGWITGR